LPRQHRAGHTFVLEREGQAVGFARAGTFRSVGDRWSFAKPGDGLIFGPFVSAADMRGGEQLIASCTRYFSQVGADNVWAFDPVESVGAPFYNGGWCGLSEKLPSHVQLFAKTGFQIHYRELCLRRILSDVPERENPRLGLTVSFEKRDNHHLSVKLYDRGVYAGSCHYSRMHPNRGAHPSALCRGYVDGLSVNEGYQGKGLGRFLLLTGLEKLREMECETVSLTTASDNLRAQNLYFSVGFQVVDSCLTFASEVSRINSRIRA